MKIEHDTPEAIDITDKAVRDLLQHEKALQVKHTPAPWTFAVEDGTFKLKDSSGNTMMCDETYYPWTPADKGDWQLIAAAPDLLEALQWYVENDDVILEMNEFYAEGYHKAKAAITKALGA